MNLPKSWQGKALLIVVFIVANLIWILELFSIPVYYR